MRARRALQGDRGGVAAAAALRTAADGSTGAALGAQLLQALDRVVEDLVPLAEREAHQRLSGLDVVVDHLVRERYDAAARGQGAAELHAVGVAERSNVGGDEVGAGRLEDLEADPAETSAESVPLGAQGVTQAVVVGVRQPEPQCDR